MNHKKIIGIDLGGTNVRGGLVNELQLSQLTSTKVNAEGSVEEVLEQLFNLTDKLINKSVAAIGIGVPGLVDIQQGIVYDVVNIPSWREVPLKKLMEDRYSIPVVINNDANCFALGEFYFGKGKGSASMVGLTIGTGLGGGIIINNQLYSGAHGGAGEFGTADYKDKTVEYYASGQFFENIYNIDGQIAFERATKGDREALKMYEEMGVHLGNAIKMILYTLDVELIVFGGSVRHAYPYFSKTMWEQIRKLVFRLPAEKLQIKISELENSGILGAAALYYDSLAAKGKSS
jgi:glucokinase